MIKTNLVKIELFILIAIVVISGYGGMCGTSGGTNTSGSSVPQPSVTTISATAITYNSVTLNGIVNPHGVNTDAYFRWGKTTPPTTSVGHRNVGAGTTDVSVSYNLNTGLSANTLYYFRLVTINSYGSTFLGSILTFTTLEAPPSCTTNAASDITPVSAKLNGTVNPNGSDVTSCYFDYGISPSYTATITVMALPGNGTNPVAVSATINSLLSGTDYNFRIVGINAHGTNYGNNKTLTTGSTSVSPTCTTDDVNNVTYNSARLYGTVNPNGSTTNAYFEYGITTNPYPFSTTLQLIGGGITSVAITATISGLSGSTDYNFRVRGENTHGINYGYNMTFTTSVAPTPSTVTYPSPTAINITSNSAILNGLVNPNGCNVTSCYFDYGLNPSYGSTATASPSPGGGINPVNVSADISGLTSTKAYYFRLQATNAGGTTYGTQQVFVTKDNWDPGDDNPSGSTPLSMSYDGTPHTH
jgi:hypothetical protein